MTRWIGRTKRALAPRDHAPSITCSRCGTTSHKPEDVARRFCRDCGEFLDLIDLDDQSA
ncbi:MAG: hypothetical protein JWR20_1646 [Marmoricola sp.]|nr:hypothetical protein [Marmoricola sp.]